MFVFIIVFLHLFLMAFAIQFVKEMYIARHSRYII